MRFKTSVCVYCGQGVESISDYAITFHYVSVEQLYNLDFYVYHLRPYGIVSGLQELNRKPDDDDDDDGHEPPVTPRAPPRAVTPRRQRSHQSADQPPPVINQDQPPD